MHSWAWGAVGRAERIRSKSRGVDVRAMWAGHGGGGRKKRRSASGVRARPTAVQRLHD